MMNLQARELCAPYINSKQMLRAYPTNSPRAKARLIVLAMLVDGRLDDAELERLDREDIFVELGITREDFRAVFFDFCADLENLPNAGGDYLVHPVVLKQLLGEVDITEDRQTLLVQILDMIYSDGRLEDGELELLRHTVNTWKLTTADTLMCSQSLPS